MALAQSSKRKGVVEESQIGQNARRQAQKKFKAEDTGGIAEGKMGWADTQIEVGGARDEFSCLQVGSVG